MKHRLVDVRPQPVGGSGFDLQGVWPLPVKGVGLRTKKTLSQISARAATRARAGSIHPPVIGKHGDGVVLSSSWPAKHVDSPRFLGMGSHLIL